MGEKGNGMEAFIAQVKAALAAIWPGIEFSVKEFPVRWPGIPNYIEIDWVSDPAGPADAHVLLVAEKYYPYVLSEHSKGRRSMV